MASAVHSCLGAIGCLTSGLLPFILAVSGAGKLLAWETFDASLRTYTLIPPSLAELAGAIVPAAELVPLCVLAQGHFARANKLAMGLVALFTAVVGFHWIRLVQPECACLGLWAIYLRAESLGSEWLIRNGVLLAIGTAGMVIGRRRASLVVTTPRGPVE